MKEKEELLYAVLAVTRTELCRSFPSLNLAFAWLSGQVSENSDFATDGSHLYLSEKVLAWYADSPASVRRGYFHTLLHCLFGHINPPVHVDPELWDLACDIMVEKQISDLHEERLHTDNAGRDAVLKILFGGAASLEAGTSAQSGGLHSLEIMELLKGMPELADKMAELKAAFLFDDHRLWWEGISPDTLGRWRSLGYCSEALGGGSRGTAGGNMQEGFTLLQSDPRDYRPLLRKFMVPGEEMELDDESFDYIYYDFGIRQYGNLPLLEPLEYREVHRLDELVIAIDTSYSCDADTVSCFLQETYAILTSQENFFRRMKVVLIQCDCWIQDMAVIHSREEWLNYVWNLEIHGRGGTDFGPVFREIERLRREGILKKPRALLYFTDGDGVYPHEGPDYETVFILAGRKKHPELLPRWAICREVLDD